MGQPIDHDEAKEDSDDRAHAVTRQWSDEPGDLEMDNDGPHDGDGSSVEERSGPSSMISADEPMENSLALPSNPGCGLD